MRYSVLVAFCVFCSVIYTVQCVEARPGKRFDDRTQMCRVLDKGGPLDWESDHWGVGGYEV